MVRFRTLGCYPLTGAIESQRDHAARGDRGDVTSTSIGAAGPADRSRPAAASMEKKKQRGLFLMARPTPSGRRAIGIDARDRPARPCIASRNHSLLRFVTCGSVDDGKSTLIGRLLFETRAGIRRPAGALEGGLGTHRNAGRRTRLRAAARRARGGTRAGHHHRCRLPLLLHRRSASSSLPIRPAMSNTRATW